MLRFLTAGESHGQALMAILDGMPSGMPIDVDHINQELWRRQQGYGRSSRQKIEKDQIEIIGGVRHGITTGAPIGFLIKNKDWENWQYVMSSLAIDSTMPEAAKQLASKAIKQFRPGHADLPGTMKFRQKDIRDVLERASARETATRVAVGAICQQLLQQFNIKTAAHVLQVGNIKAESINADQIDLSELDNLILQSEMFCIDPNAERSMKEAIESTWTKGDSLGGVIEVLVDGLPIGLGTYTQWDEKLDGQLAQALMSVQAIKAVEIADATESSAKFGSQVHDPILSATEPGLPFKRGSNNAGGLEGGMTNGERLKIKAYMKPIPTLRQGLESLSFPEFEPKTAHFERSDICAISAASVVCKSMVAFVLAKALLNKFGGDTLADIKLAHKQYLNYCQNPADNPKVGSK